MSGRALQWLAVRGAIVLMAAAIVLPVRGARAQGARAFSVYIDCSGFYCDPDFYRTDITFVDHVRERTAADVHVLITRQPTGGGGRAYTLAFYGQHAFEKIDDTLTVVAPQGATEDEQRQTLSRTVKLGLARYVARTPAATRASLSVTAPTDTVAAKPTRDPWNAWVFRIGANLNASRERGFSSDYVFGSVSAARVTEQWKTEIRVNENYSGQTFETDLGRVTSVKRDYGGSLQQVRSIGRRWAAGLTASAGSSTFLNQHLVVSVAPAIEYNVFPYSEATRHALVFRYSAGGRYLLYNDTTIYFKISETRPYEALSAGIVEKQKWGSLEFDVNGYHFLDDISKSRLTFDAQVDVRLFKGLSLRLFGDYSVVHDQIYLSKAGLSRNEVLLRQGQLATSYSAFVFGGLNYTFGSVLNNVVNPRFTGGMNGF
ncbi:MAG TPA: hypothetical protein VG432_09190 [Gemmatimonadaceae bacterium]|nr:hypothetical protein [Gemmatimonadaceae bacterium]